MDQPVTAVAEFDVTFGAAGTPSTVTVEAASPTEVVLVTENANLPVLWRVESGDLPDGLAFHGAGVVRGTPMDDGTFVLDLSVRDAIGLEARVELTLEVTPPNVGSDALAATFFGRSSGLTVSQLEYLDRHGNANGGYDLGDFRAFVLDHPDLPATARESGTTAAARVTVPVSFLPEEQR
jgi:hypothetical protein